MSSHKLKRRKEVTGIERTRNELTYHAQPLVHDYSCATLDDLVFNQNSKHPRLF